MTAWAPAVSGDINDYRTITLSGVQDLTAVSAVEAHVWLGTTTATLTASVVSAVARTIRVELGGSSGWLKTAAAGSWGAEIEVTFTDTSVLTWPTQGYDTLVVRAQGD